MYIYIADYNLKKILDFNKSIDFLFNIAHENPEIYNHFSNVDPYGVTYFSNPQIQRSLLKEIDSAIEKLDNKEELKEFKNFIKNIQHHNYLVIVWD